VSSATDTEELTGVAGWAVDLMETMGGPGAGLAIAIENLFPPIPSEIVLPLAGFTASQGSFTLAEAIFWTTLGSVVGALAMYGLGAVLGRRRMYVVWGWLPLVKTEDLQRCEAWFDQHGTQAVFLGRMVPIFRSLVSVPAGIERMSIPVFLLLTTLGSLLWNTTFIVAGYELGEQWHRVDPYASTFQKVVIAVAVFLVCWWTVNRVRTIRAARRAPGPSE
jgi:membrane protein DedA with SNARE-associated domain